MGGAAVATFVGGQSSGFGLAMPGIRELLSSASCPNWANRDFLTSAEDRCSGNARGEPAAELGAPSAIDMRSIGISNNCGLAPLRPVPPRVSVCASWSWACGPMAWPRKKTQRQTCCWSVLHGGPCMVPPHKVQTCGAFPKSLRCREATLLGTESICFGPRSAPASPSPLRTPWLCWPLLVPWPRTQRNMHMHMHMHMCMQGAPPRSSAAFMHPRRWTWVRQRLPLGGPCRSAVLPHRVGC